MPEIVLLIIAFIIANVLWWLGSRIIAYLHKPKKPEFSWTCPDCSLTIEASNFQAGTKVAADHQNSHSVVNKPVYFLITEDLKMLRETLCIAQTSINLDIFMDPSRKPKHTKRLEALIGELDLHRPLESDGKHGNLHTDTCGCEDKGPRSTWGSLKGTSEEA